MMGGIDLGDRLAQALAAIAALAALANGTFMLTAPFAWYDMVGTVRATGPANGHFLRDIGIAYVVSGALLSYGAANLALRWGAALAGAAWLMLHGALHVWEVSKGICSATIFWQEALGTLGLPLIALIGVAIVLFRMRFAPAPPRCPRRCSSAPSTPCPRAGPHSSTTCPELAASQSKSFTTSCR